MSEELRAGIVGVSGYTGAELVKLVARHPRFVLALAGSDKWAGQALGRKVAVDGDAAALACKGQAECLTGFGGLDVVFLCTPHEVSIEIAPKALAAGARVVDLSGGFRLAAADYPAWYGFAHGNPSLLGQAVYSMPEATTSETTKVRAAPLVANPGCYVTASSLAILPLLQAGVIERDGIVVDAKSGVTGAGRKAAEEFSFAEIADDFRAYRVLKHQHTPEIERVLALGGFVDVKVTFTPHLLPVRRGILATVYGRLARGGGEPTRAVRAALESFAQGRPFVRVVEPEEVTLHASVGTNRVILGGRADAERGVAVVFASIDNLIKGAAGQAVQNANLMFGLPETTGLLGLGGHAP